MYELEYTVVPHYAGAVKITLAGGHLYSGANPGDGIWYSLGDITITPPEGEVWTGYSYAFKRSHHDDNGTTGNRSGIKLNNGEVLEDDTKNEALSERVNGGPAPFAATEEFPLVVDFMYEGCDGTDDLGIDDDFELIITFSRNTVTPQEEGIDLS
jgi:hypothetical protein